MKKFIPSEVDLLQTINLQSYQKTKNGEIATPKGYSERSKSIINNGFGYHSAVNRLHIIKLANNFPTIDSDYNGDERFEPKTAYDLCRLGGNGYGAVNYHIEDFIYCKHFGQPINKLITLRRFPYGTTDNIYDTYNQMEPDIARMVTYMTQDNNKLDDVLSFGYGLKWKQLTAEFEQASMIGDQSGFEKFSKTVMQFIDPILAKNVLNGQNKLNYDPKHDSNKVYGPVDSVAETHIRDVGIEFNKEFEITFEYELRAWGGRGPEASMKDVLANILATTFVNAKFWSGARYWVGERPSQFLDRARFMAPDSIEEWFYGAKREINNALNSILAGVGKSGSAIGALRQVMSNVVNSGVIRNGVMIGLGKMLDSVGRPSIPVMNSLLSGEPIGNWHLTIGNPLNPIMCVGNLMMQNVEIKFPTDALSYGDFPTKMNAVVRLKPAMPKDKASIEMMFNMGKQRIYHNPKKVRAKRNRVNINEQYRGFYGFGKDDIERTIKDVHDFVSEDSGTGIDYDDSSTTYDSNGNQTNIYREPFYDNSYQDLFNNSNNSKTISEIISVNSIFVPSVADQPEGVGFTNEYDSKRTI